MFFLRWLAKLFGMRDHTFAEPERYVAREYIGRAAQELLDEKVQQRRERMEAARVHAIELLGSRHVLHPQYKCRASTFEAFLKQPPGILNSWRARHQDPKLRSLPSEQVRTRLKSI